MTSIAQILPYIQIVLAVIVVALVLLQQSDADVGGAFGGSDLMSSTKHTRRGIEKVLYTSTIVVGVLFLVATVAGLVIR
jgi:protein translocase SecG subunit